MIELLVDHEYAIRSNWRYKQWDANKIINVLSKGIDNSLGDGSAILLFETMMSVFKLNKDTIVSRPAILEEKLEQMLRKHYADSVIDSISKEIIKEVEFTHMSNDNANM
jgi:hypothetical protein